MGLVQGGVGMGLALVLSLLFAAITWNLATWGLGLPASSSHTLIGAILGVALANSMLPGHHFGDGVNWQKAKEIMLSLLISPVAGFAAAAALFLVFKKLSRNKELMTGPPVDGVPPPMATDGCMVSSSGLPAAEVSRSAATAAIPRCVG